MVITRDLHHSGNHPIGCSRHQIDGGSNGVPSPPAVGDNTFGYKVILMNNTAETKVEIYGFLDQSANGNWQQIFTFDDEPQGPLSGTILAALAYKTNYQ